MKFTIEWLKDHLDTDASVEQIVDTLTMTGTEVEAVEDGAKKLKDFIVCEVISAEKHPNADRLRVCMVNTGSGDPVKVVCGAPNAKTGMKGVFAAAGTYIPGTDFTLQKGKIRGEESNGMLCSERELLISNEHDGIIELPADAPVGQKYVDYANINDVLIEVEITPNRGDCVGIFGIARELAAAGIGKIKENTIKPSPSSGPSPIAPLEQRFLPDEPKTIRKFAARVFTNINNGPSPDWMQKRLLDVGLRPINSIVDITNFISLGWGRPLHAYDMDKLTGAPYLRNAKEGEEFLALDGKLHKLDNTMCVIADDSGAICLGGIMGGQATGVDGETTSVLLECASWDPLLIAKTGRKTGIVSDARYRLERSVDPALTISSMERATAMILEICGGEVYETAISGEDEAPDIVIDFPLSEVKRLTGLRIGDAEIKAALTLLGFWVSGPAKVVKVAVPSWRTDISIKADLVEEVMRIVGVDRVPVEPLPALSGVAQKTLIPIQNRRRIARRTLGANGMHEAVTWSFISKKQAQMFGGGTAELALANPISAELSDMRPSLLPGLLAASLRNANRSYSDLALFEVGQVFSSDMPEGQRTFASAIRSGSAGFNGAGRHWRSKEKKVDVFDAKADMAAVLSALGFDMDKAQLLDQSADWAHPGRGGRVQLGPKNILGWFGEIHPSILADLDISFPVVGFEIDLDALPRPKTKSSRTKPALKMSDLMPLKRDFAFIVDRDVLAGKLAKAAASANKNLISDVNIFDVFEGANLGENKKSIGLEVTIQPKENTLTDEEIENISISIIKSVEKASGGVLRS
ncbi:MAG: phenylalanine--tRNA ligase subunit beta [Devosiaceae bacterium]|nr:phenylalanine--tRNA ligase subunit beta [Devosiaceae bacterium]